MIQQRNIAVCIILSIVTCGIYGIYWFIVLSNDTNTVSNAENATSGGVAFVLSLITCTFTVYTGLTSRERRSTRHQLTEASHQAIAELYI